MIRPLRTTHRIVFFVWLVILPSLFIGGLLARHKWPVTASANSGELRAGEQALSDTHQTVGGIRFEVRVLVSSISPAERAVQIVSQTPVVVPDLLVYWSQTAVQTSLPDSAQLLGPYRPWERYPLPAGSSVGGFIVFYSLGQQKALGSLSLGKQP
jgi:hypothetical protein